MNNPTLSFHVCIEGSCESFFKLGPPYVWWFLTGVEQALDNLVRFANMNCMDTDAFIIFDESLECVTSIIWTQ